MTKEITKRERERILARGALIFFFFFFLAFLFTFFLPMEKRFLPFSAIVLIGILCSGIYTSKRFARDYEEFVWGITGFLTVCIVFGITFYQHYIGVAQRFFALILNIFLLWLPLSITISFSIFEILSSIKIKKPLSFHIKRFIGRMILTGIFVIFVVAFSSVINYLLAPFVSERYLVIILIFGYLSLSITLYKMVKNPKIGCFFSRLEKGEW